MTWVLTHKGHNANRRTREPVASVLWVLADFEFKDAIETMSKEERTINLAD